MTRDIWLFAISVGWCAALAGAFLFVIFAH
jgi:hypothetical protein